MLISIIVFRLLLILITLFYYLRSGLVLLRNSGLVREQIRRFVVFDQFYHFYLSVTVGRGELPVFFL
jgi:hypothetical protein